MTKKRFFPKHKSAPHLPAEPEDIDEEGTLNESEKAILERTVTEFGKDKPEGISPIPAQFKASSSPVVGGLGAGASSGKTTPIVFASGSGGGSAVAPSKDSIRAMMREASNTEPIKQVYGDISNRRAFLVKDLERCLTNTELGAPLFNGLDRFEVANVVSAFQEALIDYVLDSPLQSQAFNLPSLNPLLLRTEEDKRNRRALLDLCNRLDISAEELTLKILKESLAAEAWRIGSDAQYIPDLELTSENEQQWRLYKEELGLVKRRK